MYVLIHSCLDMSLETLSSNLMEEIEEVMGNTYAVKQSFAKKGIGHIFW